MDFQPLAFHLEQTEAHKRRMSKLYAMAATLAPYVMCTCDFTEQNQHIGCPFYTLSCMLELTKKHAGL